MGKHRRKHKAERERYVLVIKVCFRLLLTWIHVWHVSGIWTSREIFVRHFELIRLFLELMFSLEFVCRSPRIKKKKKTKTRQGNCKVCRVNYEVPRSTFRLRSLSISSSDTCDYRHLLVNGQILPGKLSECSETWIYSDSLSLSYRWYRSRIGIGNIGQ